jgi:hypothetical protein
MKPKELQKLVEEIAALGITQPTGIGGVGEPTLHPNFHEMVTTVSRIPWCFGSNCNNMLPVKSYWVVKHRPSVVALSMDAMTENTMKKIRPGVNLGVAAHNIKSFIRSVGQVSRDVWADPKLFVQMIVMNQNVHEVDEWVGTWAREIEEDPRWKLHLKEVIEWPGINGSGLWSAKVKRAIDKWAGHPRIQVSYRAPIREHCRLMHNFAWVMSDGTYSPCCMHSDDEWEVGNAIDTSINECYWSGKMGQYRIKHGGKAYDGMLCKECK